MIEEKIAEQIGLKRKRMREMFKVMTGYEDSTSFELVNLIHIAAIEMEKATNQRVGAHRMSGPRWGILFRIFAEEKIGSQGGATPTELSQLQGVSKNTMSSLIRGLEEQGLIIRTLDPIDHRLFRIQLTPKGRELVVHAATRHNLETLELTSCFSHEESVQMVALLEKLVISLKKKSKQKCMEATPNEETKAD
jgi:DNA-binding MarR family transcriptional regulator